MWCAHFCEHITAPSASLRRELENVWIDTHTHTPNTYIYIYVYSIPLSMNLHQYFRFESNSVFTLVFPLSKFVAPFSDMCYPYYIYLVDQLLNVFDLLLCPLPPPAWCAHPLAVLTLSTRHLRSLSYQPGHPPFHAHVLKSCLRLPSKWKPSSVHWGSLCWDTLTGTPFSLSSGPNCPWWALSHMDSVLFLSRLTHITLGSPHPARA